MSTFQRPAGASHAGASSSAAGAAAIYLSCFSGPDIGKRIALAQGYVTLGSSSECNVLSDDQEVTRKHAVIALEGDTVSVQSVDGATLFIDGTRTVGVHTLLVGQQLRVGRSLWRLTNAQGEVPATSGFFSKWSARVSQAAGLERIQGFSPADLFSDVFKKRSDEEIEDYFVVGTQHTTPDLSLVATDWPKPWAFARIFLMSVAAYTLLVYGFNEFGNRYFLPGIIVVGSVAFPFAILMFFFEMNVPRNVSLLFLFKWMIFGGVISLLVALFGFRYSNLSSWLGSMSAGIVEESGKLAILLLVARNVRYRWTLNGLLIGAAVGTGFSIFETMGYVFVQGLLERGLEGMFSIITSRGWLNLLGDHSLWTGLVGAALWRVRGDRPFRLDMLGDPRFLRVFVVVILLHMINNAPFSLPLYGKYVLIGFVAWVVIFSFIQYGLREVRAVQLTGARPAT